MKRIHCVAWAIATTAFLLRAAPATAEEGKATDFPGLGKPQILFVADEDWKQGYFCSLAFTEDRKSLVATLVRNPGSATPITLQQRVGEVWSFDLANEGKAPSMVTTVRNMQYKILTTPSGACRDPLLLARWHHVRPKEIVVFHPAHEGLTESLRTQIDVPHHEVKFDPWSHTGPVLAVTPSADTLILGRGGSELNRDHPQTDWERGLIWWGQVQAFDLRTGKSRFTDTWDGQQVLDVACSPDGKLIAAAGGHTTPAILGPKHYDGRVVCWDEIFEKRLDLTLPHHQIHCLAFSPDSISLLTGGLDGVVKWIDMAKGTVVDSLNVASHSGKTLGRVESLAFSPNGQLLATGTGSWNRGNKWGETFLIDIPKSQVFKVHGSHEEHVITSVAFSPDGKYLATGGMAGILKLWKINGANEGKQ